MSNLREPFMKSKAQTKILSLVSLREKCPYSKFSGPHFPAFGLNTPYLSVFSPNPTKYGPEKLQIWTFFTQRIAAKIVASL